MTIQIRSVDDGDPVFDSFHRTKINTGLYTVLFFEPTLITPNYQLSHNTTVSDATTLEPENTTEYYCRLCETRKSDTIKSEVWFRSNKSHETNMICLDCAETLLEYRDKYIEKIDTEKLLGRLI